MKKNKIYNFLEEYWFLSLIIWWPIVLFIFMLIFSPKAELKMVHWHMPISYDLCWDTRELNDEWKHWKIHWHNDWKIHIEWNVNMLNRTETLWKFMDSAKIPFSKTQIWKYKNGDNCPWSDKPWKVKVLINWKENNEFRNYVLNDKDKIKIIFK